MSFQTEDTLNKDLDSCNKIRRRTLHQDEYLNFDKHHCKNRVSFTITYDFEGIEILKNQTRIKNIFLLLVSYIEKVNILIYSKMNKNVIVVKT